jgi:lactoylglutathione lyase
MLRIKDPQVTLPFYEQHFGFKLVHKYDFPQWKFSLYFMTTVPEGTVLPTPGTKEAEQYLWTMKGTCIEFTHNHGSETDDSFKVNNGNVEPHRGFGHIAVMTKDVYGHCEELERNGVKFQKRPNEGRMKGLAFALDPDGYWVEIIKRREEAVINDKFTFAQTMLRIKDAQKSLHFYRDLLGMKLLNELHFSDFSLYFLAHVSPEDEEAVAQGGVSALHGPVLELTHNHGTENNPDFKYHNGNDEADGAIRGFGHTGFLTDDLTAACSFLESEGVAFKKKPEDGNMHTLAFAYDPDNYWVEIIQKGSAV